MASTDPLHPKDPRPIAFQSIFRWIYLPEPPTSLDHHFRSVAGLASCVTPSLKRRTGSTGILNLLPIAYAFRPELRDRLTLGGRTFPRKPWDFGGEDFHLTFRYSCPHNHLYVVQPWLPTTFNPTYNAPLPRSAKRIIRSFGR